MYLKLLKKDLKRKRTMNIIFLVFIIMASAFISSSAYNLKVISTGLDSYFDAANVGDLIVVANESDAEQFESFFDKSANASSYSASRTALVKGFGDEKNIENVFLTEFKKSGYKFFDGNDNEITAVNEGEIYIPAEVLDDFKLNVGDDVYISAGDGGKTFKIVSSLKDAGCGGTIAGINRLLINENDFKLLTLDKNKSPIYIFYSISANDSAAFKNEFYKSNLPFVMAFDRETCKFTYLMDTLISLILLIISVVLILIALIVLRFIIAFTLEQDFREIGVMKAIGINHRQIRVLYLVKYFAIALVGSILGVVFGLPISRILISISASRIVLTESSGGIALRLMCGLAVVLTVLLFGYFYTGRLKKFSPVDAIRSSSAGERFSKKSVLSLKRSGKTPIPLFLSANDILSGIKKYLFMILIFVMGVSLIIIPLNAVSTLKSEKMIKSASMLECDGSIEISNDLLTMSLNEIQKVFSKTEKELSGNGVNVKMYMEILVSVSLSHGDNYAKLLGMQGVNTNEEEYLYTDGTAPKLENEIAVTKLTAKALDAEIGDEIDITVSGQTNKYIITATYESMVNTGNGIRFSNKADLDYTQKAGYLYLQFKFTDDLTPSEKAENIEKIRKLYPDKEVKTPTEFSEDITGVASTFDDLSKATLFLVLGINALIAVLMVTTFIIREKGEIGCLKAIGFKNGTLMLWQGLRITIVLLISTIIAIAVSYPLTKLLVETVFNMFGVSNIQVAVEPLKAFLIYPLILLIVTTAFSILAALQIKRIKPRDIINIE